MLGLLPCNVADFQLSQSNPTVSAVDTGVHPRACLKFENALIIVQQPHAGERSLDMFDNRFSALLQNTSQVHCAC
jgi:hypothetical protein